MVDVNDQLAELRELMRKHRSDEEFADNSYAVEAVELYEELVDQLTDTEKLAKVLCKVEVAPGQNIKVSTVWRSMSPDVRKHYRNRAICLLDLLADPDA